jgi:molybdopterin-binding protein
LDGVGFEHDIVHTSHSGAIIAIETKLGSTDSNAVANTVLGGTGASTSSWTGSPTLSGTVTASAFAGPITGAVTGNVTGNVTGDITGDLTGAVTGAASDNLLLAGGTMAGVIDHNDLGVTKPLLKDYSETINTIASSTVLADIDIELGNVIDMTLDNNPTLTFTNPAVTGTGGSFSLILRQDGSGSRTVTWPGVVKWAGGTAPTLTTTASRADIFTFVTVDEGATCWFGFVAGQDFY